VLAHSFSELHNWYTETLTVFVMGIADATTGAKVKQDTASARPVFIFRYFSISLFRYFKIWVLDMHTSSTGLPEQMLLTSMAREYAEDKAVAACQLSAGIGRITNRSM
jgi:hypothetical protein